jgi:hypothetical protein
MVEPHDSCLLWAKGDIFSLLLRELTRRHTQIIQVVMSFLQTCLCLLTFDVLVVLLLYGQPLGFFRLSLHNISGMKGRSSGVRV